MRLIFRFLYIFTIKNVISFNINQLSQYNKRIIHNELGAGRTKPNWGPTEDRVVSEEEGKEFFDYIFSNPIYEARESEKLTAKDVKQEKAINRNTLQNLGKYAFDSMLDKIKQTINERLEEEQTSPVADLKEAEGEVNKDASTASGNDIYNDDSPTDSFPPEAQSTSPSLAESSSNYLPVNGNATPGDRGNVQPLRTEILPGGTEDVSPEEQNSTIVDVTSSGLPGADLREAEGEVNRRADGRKDLMWNGVWTTSNPKAGASNVTSGGVGSIDSLGTVYTDGLFGTYEGGRCYLESLENTSDDDTKVINQMKRDILKYKLKNLSKNNHKTIKLFQSNDYINGLNYRKLGGTDLIVSELGIGTSMFDNPELIDYEHSIEIMETAYKRYGINFFDTCEYDPYPYDPRSYINGQHKTLNKFLKLVNRQDIILSGRLSSNNIGKYKTSGRFLSWVRDDIHSLPNLKIIENALDKLLLKLDTDYLDILSFVYPYRYIPLSHLGEDTYCWSKEINNEQDIFNELIEILNILVNKGKIKSIGLSNETIWGVYKILNHNNRKFNVACTQQLYNLLHRNELESSGLVEGSLSGHMNCPIVSYGVLAGGILTGKYLDPEKINPAGADKISEPISFSHDQHGVELCEDYGHLTYGPSNARCNIFPDTYHTHRSVWCQHATSEYIKIARTHGLTLSQLSIKWALSRPFMLSTIIGLRSIGQLHETIGALNYPLSDDVVNDIHEVYLRYRAPTMGGPLLLTGLDEEYDTIISQNDRLRYAPMPIWSGGSHWNMDDIPSLDELRLIKSHEDEYHQIRRIFGLLDKPNDSRWQNYRCWVERIYEGLPGEYFAVKESKLFSWDTMRLREYTLINKTPEEIKEDDTSHFHFYWKNGKVYVGDTTDAIRRFYDDHEAVNNVVKERERSFLLARGFNRIPKDWKIWSPVDADLVYKRLLEKYGIDILNTDELERLIYKTGLDDLKLSSLKEKCRKFAYFTKHENNEQT